MRYSKQRESVLKVVNNSYDHPNAETIYKRVKEIIPNISLGTVYRNLNSLVLDNQIRIIKGLDNKDRYDKTLHDHGHTLCTKCNTITDLTEDEIISLKNKLKKEGFQIQNYNIIINGLCHKCHTKERGI